MNTNNELTQNPDCLKIDEQTIQNIMQRRHRSERKSQFKNPPQPRFCIKETTSDGRTVFINILSYNKIANQQSEYDPIPLYGGMQIRPVSSFKNAPNLQQPENLPIIFAVMASPEILKKTGRNYADSPEQMNLVELMCEFVEAMNVGIVLSKKPEILKDRDLTGELKEIWSSVQNFRDKEKAGMSDIVVYTDFGPESPSIQPSDPNEPYCKDSEKSVEGEAVADFAMSNDTSNVERAVSNEKGHAFDNGIKSADIENLSIGDKKTGAKKVEESRDEIVKLQNQKNKSQSNFFPKFLSSSKENSTKAAKDTKKSLNFFRRNKSSSSPTHTPSDNATNNLKSDSDN